METEILEAAKPKASGKRRARAGKPDRGIFEKVPGSGIWWIRYTDTAGEYHREKAGTKSVATKLYNLRKADALHGKLPELRKRAIPFSELIDTAIAHVERHYSRPADEVGRLKLIKEWFAGRGAESMTSSEIRAALDKAATENRWAASTTNHHHNMIGLCFRLAVEHEKIKASPIHGKVRKRKENNSRVRFLSTDEEKRLRATLAARPEWAEHIPELDFAMHTGLRRESMYVDLVWENVDLQHRVATIPQTKNGDPLTIPLNDVAMRALQIFRMRSTGSSRVVRNSFGETLNVNAHWFVPALRAAGIKDFRWHDLRHHYASMLRQRGVPLGHIAELLGHKGLAMSKRYAHLHISNLHEAVAKLTTNSTTVAPEPALEDSEVFVVH
jgi:integrase